MNAFLRKITTAWRVLRKYGLLVFLEETIERLGIGIRDRGQSIVARRNVIETSETPRSNFAVSVVIPTRNGGSDLQKLLRSLLDQHGCELEIILVDSGSSDGSLDTTEASYAKILAIQATEFSHSGSRNLGVSACSHDLVLLTVQDAYVPDPYWLGDLVQMMTSYRLSALSVAEVPRPDADLYAKYSVATHNKSISIQKNHIHFSRTYFGNRRDKVKAASIGNVACLYRKVDLLRLPFQGQFGEDFTAAIRFLRHGLRVGRTNVLQIVHSHNRVPLYWLKRMYLSRVLLREQGLSERTYLKNKGDVKSSVGTVLKVFLTVSTTNQTVEGLGKWLEDNKKASAQFDCAAAKAALERADRDLMSFLDRFGLIESLNEKSLDSEILEEISGFLSYVQAVKVNFAVEESEFPYAILCAMASKLGWKLGGIDGDEGWRPGEIDTFHEQISSGV